MPYAGGPEEVKNIFSKVATIAIEVEQVDRWCPGIIFFSLQLDHLLKRQRDKPEIRRPQRNVHPAEGIRRIRGPK